jgi:hypothetical protein
MDNEGRKAVNFAEELRTPAMRNEIVKLLEEKESMLG